MDGCIARFCTFGRISKEKRKSSGEDYLSFSITYLSCDQESTYNLGRAAHQLGMKALAVEFYKKALEVEPLDRKFDLRREIAYNLILIYKESGAIPLARDVMKKYLTI